jgi:uncharacterized membrane protein YheB (UPF0754 family)
MLRKQISIGRMVLAFAFLSVVQVFRITTAFNNDARLLNRGHINFPTASAIRKRSTTLPRHTKTNSRPRLRKVQLEASPFAASAMLTTGISGILRKGLTTFLLDWKTYSFIPLVAGFVGWFTNYLAVQMIFYPIKWTGISIRRVEGEPLGLLGWQGIIPAKTMKMSEAMVNVTINELLSMEETIMRLDPQRVADILAPEVPEMLEDVLEEYLKNQNSPAALRAVAKSILNEKNKEGKWLVSELFGRKFLEELTIDMQQNIVRIFNVLNCVTSKMMADRSLLGKLFQKTGGKELKFVTDSGLWFGFLLGCVQMIVSVYCHNPWTLSIGGLIVGLATNWLALKWIFEPVEPLRIGPFVLQGMFLKRQKQVANDFSEFFSKRILNSEEIWNSILSDPSTSPSFRSMFARNLVKLAGGANSDSAGSDHKSRSKEEQDRDDLGQRNLDKAVSQVTFKLPYHFQKTSFHAYVDETLEIKKTLQCKSLICSGLIHCENIADIALLSVST